MNAEGTDEDDTGAEDRRLFGGRREKVTVYVGAELGLTCVQIAADRVGQFSLVERGDVRCVATDESDAATVVAVATDETVLAGEGDRFESVGFGLAATVGVDDEFLYAASADGEVARLPIAAVGDGDSEWEQVGTVTEPRRFAGAHLAATDGVYRVGDGLEHLGLADARDVTYSGKYAATADGLYRLDGEWVQESDGGARAVAARGAAVHALADGHLLAREGGEWTPVDLPTEETPVDLAHGLGVYVLTAAGTLVVEADPEATSDGHAGWRSRALGVRSARRLAVRGLMRRLDSPHPAGSRSHPEPKRRLARAASGRI